LWYNSGVGEPTSAKRQVRPWVAIVATAAALVIFGGIWFVVGSRKADREFSRPGHGIVHRSKAWTRANGLCRRLNMVGNGYANRGMFDSALTCYREVLRISQEEGLGDRMAAAYSNISNIFDDMQMPESARFYMNASMALDRLSKKPGKVMNSLFEQGTYQFSVLGDYDSAIVLLEKALAESRSKRDSVGEAGALCNLGIIQGMQNHYDSAKVLLESCATRCHANKDASGEASALNNIAMMYLRRDRETEAKKWLIKAVDAAHAGDVVGEEAPALFHLGLIRADEDDYELAQANVEQALKLYERAGDQDGIRRCRNCLDALIEAQRWKHRSKVLDSLFEDYKKQSSSNPGI
jgi:tetratricopeptide (TPR) repeat protein